ncbi:MAG TPA: deoxyribodipyrimidine photo-lyase [Candidatus Competibacter sp.]|nr:cryptochrome DASH [Candidatus Competibacteraceae bacterium]HRE54978.1 deoxyribodipyrimidine photo-lyase [Candidatus Competibacter sp.]HUM95675.1 deoxyribodipyrimidine photo-lyase [Candidatus Competibacter sp.]
MMTERCAIIWFRNDLRLHDHEVLTLLANSVDVLAPVYCLDPARFEIQPSGFPLTGPLRARFLIECLEDLRAGLEARGSGLHVVVGQPEQVLPALAQKLGAREIFAEREVLGEPLRVERRLAAALDPLGISLHGYRISTLTHPNDLPFPVANLPESFAQFQEAVTAGGEPRAALPPLQRLPGYPAGLSNPTLDTLVQVLGLSAGSEAGQPSGFEGGATVAVAKLEEFVQGRRASLESLRGSGSEAAAQADRFAPWLACGALSPRRIYQYVKYSGLTVWAGELANAVITGLQRRDFCRFLAMKRGERDEQSSRPPAWDDEGLRERFELWRQGETGEPFVDAHLRELAMTGHLSSFGRRLVASYLCHDLGLDWRWGAAWFASQLLDDDPSVNLANWMEATGRWRAFEEPGRLDPAEQAARRDPDGDYCRRWLDGNAPVIQRFG